MRTIEETIKDMGEINDTDRLEVSHDFDHGNYTCAYVTENYDVVHDDMNGKTGFYRIGCLVGFFSSYELHEIPERWRDEVAHYREVIRALDLLS